MPNERAQPASTAKLKIVEFPQKNSGSFFVVDENNTIVEGPYVSKEASPFLHHADRPLYLNRDEAQEMAQHTLDTWNLELENRRKSEAVAAVVEEERRKREAKEAAEREAAEQAEKERLAKEAEATKTE